MSFEYDNFTPFLEGFILALLPQHALVSLEMDVIAMQLQMNMIE